MTTKLDLKFTSLLSDTASKLQSLEVLPRVHTEAAEALIATASELGLQLNQFAMRLIEAQEAKIAADEADKEAARLAKEQAIAEKNAQRVRIQAEKEAAKLAAAEAKIKAMEDKEAARLAKEQAAAEKAAERARLDAERDAARKAAAEAKERDRLEREAAREAERETARRELEAMKALHALLDKKARGTPPVSPVNPKRL